MQKTIPTNVPNTVAVSAGVTACDCATGLAYVIRLVALQYCLAEMNMIVSVVVSFCINQDSLRVQPCNVVVTRINFCHVLVYDQHWCFSNTDFVC